MQLQIESQSRANDVVDKLQHWLTNPDNSVSGVASESTVRVIRTQSLGNSVFRPEFNGNITSAPVGCNLHGHFQFSSSASGILKAWFSGVGVLVIASAGMGIRTQYPEWWPVPVGGIGVLLFGVLFVWFSRHYYREDKDWIIEQLRIQLEVHSYPPHEKARQTPGSAAPTVLTKRL